MKKKDHFDLEEIFSKLSEGIIPNVEDYDLIKQSIKLLSAEVRPQYSILTKFVYSRNDDEREKLDILEMNLLEIYKEAKEESVKKYVEKLIDHLNLALHQTQYIDQKLKIITEKMNITETRTQKINNIITKTYDTLQKMEKLKDEIYVQFVAILGIFATIIFAAFGGLNILNNILGNIKGVSVSKLFILSSISLAGINLLLFLLLESIAKITGKNLRHCGCNFNEKCLHNIYQKHPTFMFSNLILFYIFIVGVVTYLFKIGTFVSLIKPFSVVIVIFLFALGLFIPGFFVYKYKSDPLKKKKTT